MNLANPLRTVCVSAALLLAASPLLAAPADQIRARMDGFKALGAAFKSVNDALRADGAPPAVFIQAAQRISATARDQHRWFPAGSGPESGVKTYAKPEIWTRSADFRMALNNFAAAARSFEGAAVSGNIAAIRGEARKLGGTCKGCHDTFRTPKD